MSRSRRADRVDGMSTEVPVLRAPGASASRPRVAAIAAIVFCGVVPLLAMAALFADAVGDDVVATDFRQFYRAAELILEGESPYRDAVDSLATWGGPYPYPPLPALAAIPLTVLPLDIAGVLVMAVLLAVALGTLWILGVRDWRCYGVMLLWPPVISAIQTGNVTLFFALAAALVWRYRDRTLTPAVSIGVTLAAKFFLWPLVAWLAATRRTAGAAIACVVGVGLLALSWATIGFAGAAGYPDLLERLEEVVGEDSYTLYIVGLDAGLPSPVSRALWIVLGLTLVGAVAWLGRGGNESGAFILALAAALALTPIVWLHYFALLVVVVAIAQPRLGYLWFLPLAMIVTPGSGHPTPFETAWTLAAAALTIGLAVREARREVGWSSRSMTSLPAARHP